MGYGLSGVAAKDSLAVWNVVFEPAGLFREVSLSSHKNLSAMIQTVLDDALTSLVAFCLCASHPRKSRND